MLTLTYIYIMERHAEGAIKYQKRWAWSMGRVDGEGVRPER